MRVGSRKIHILLLVAAGVMLGGCENTSLLQLFDNKAKLPGNRTPVFPEGVPGVQQGVPPELMKGAHAQQEQQVQSATAAAEAEKAAAEERKRAQAERAERARAQRAAQPRPQRPPQRAPEPEPGQAAAPPPPPPQPAPPPAAQRPTSAPLADRWPTQQQQQQQPQPQAQQAPSPPAQPSATTRPWPGATQTN